MKIITSAKGMKLNKLCLALVLLSLILGLASTGAQANSFVLQKRIDYAVTEHYLEMPGSSVYKDPYGITAIKFSFDPDNNLPTLFAADPGYSRIVYNVGQDLLFSKLKYFGTYGIGPGQFDSPYGVAAYKDGSVYASDTKLHRMTKLLYGHGELVYIKNFGSRGSGNGQFRIPRQVAADENGNVYVADSGNNRIQKFDADGNFIRSFDGFLMPYGVAVDKNGNLYVCDTGNQSIKKLDSNGDLLKTFNAADSGLVSPLFSSISTDYNDRPYVVDSSNNQILKFDADLNLVVAFGSKGVEPGQFLSPRGIAIYKSYGEIFITESTGGQYYDLSVDILNLKTTPLFSPYAEENTAQIEFMLTENAYTNVDVLDGQGKTIKTLAAGSARHVSCRNERQQEYFVSGNVF